MKLLLVAGVNAGFDAAGRYWLEPVVGHRTLRVDVQAPDFIPGNCCPIHIGL
jgi:hypothetical protein